jgi:LysR family glycine cleavage system transcriptional activator
MHRNALGIDPQGFMKRLPPLQTLRSLEAAARLLSFTAAADELHVTQSAVSQQIRQLEQSLGKRLFHRLTRRLALTPEGEIFVAAAKQALAFIAQAVVELGSGTLSVDLLIAAVPSLSSRWLVPRLPRFRSLNPNLDVTIYPAFEPAEIEQCRADVGILYGDGNWPGYQIEKLLTESIFPVCRRDLLKNRRLTSVDDIFSFTLLRDADPRHEYWPSWLAAAGARQRSVRRGPRFDNLSDMVAAALDGQGVALVRSALVLDDLRSGRLVRLFATQLPAQFSYYMVWPRHPTNLPLTLIFRDWVVREMVDGSAGEKPAPRSKRRRRAPLCEGKLSLKRKTG